MIGILISTLILLLTPNCVCFLSEYGELTNPDGLATMTIHKPEICIAQAQKHDIVSYHYIGRLASDSSIFGRSFDYNTPYITPLGEDKIIAGMEQGLIGTCLGERRRITVPSHLGYGKRGAGAKIPPDSTLVFYIQLLEIEREGIAIGSEPTLARVYETANNNYEAQKWRNAVNAYEFGINLFREFENKTVECVRQCNKNASIYGIVEIDIALLKSSIPGYGNIQNLLPDLQKSKCLQSCRSHSFTNKQLDVSYTILDNFFSKHFYLSLQWAYNKIGDQYNAAVYNQMYYNMYPDVNMSRQNKQYYEREYGTDYKSVRNKALNYMTHYYFQTGVEAYHSSQWDVCIEDINLALHQYKEDLERCRDFCSAFPISKASTVVSQYTGIHLAQIEGLEMQCKSECLYKIEMVEGEKIKNLLGILLGYIHVCYYQKGQIEEGYRAAITWRAMDFSDANAESAVNFYHKQTNIVPTKYEPMEEYVKIKERHEIEARLLTFYLTESFPKKQGVRGEYASDMGNLKKTSQGKIRDEL